MIVTWKKILYMGNLNKICNVKKYCIQLMMFCRILCPFLLQNCDLQFCCDIRFERGEKNSAKNYAHGENMTNMRYDHSSKANLTIHEKQMLTKDDNGGGGRGSQKMTNGGKVRQMMTIDDEGQSRNDQIWLT